MASFPEVLAGEGGRWVPEVARVRSGAGVSIGECGAMVAGRVEKLELELGLELLLLSELELGLELGLGLLFKFGLKLRLEPELRSELGELAPGIDIPNEEVRGEVELELGFGTGM
jgi:hypothetical protein